MIHADLKELEVSVHTLQFHPRNVRQGDVGAIAESLKQNGQYKPITVQKSTGYVLAGNHTLKAALALGWETIAATYVDVTDEHALRILLVDNHTNDLAHYNEPALAELLQELAETHQGLNGTGYEPEELEELIKELSDQPTATDTPPAISELLDTSAVEELQDAINTADIPEQLRTFLHAAKWNRTTYNHHKITQFTQHQTPEVQQLIKSCGFN